MEAVTITFTDGSQILAEQNGSCFITGEKPDFPDDLSEVVISSDSDEYTLHNAELIECASVDGRYWFSFTETTNDEIRQRELENAIQLLTDCVLEMSETIYA